MSGLVIAGDTSGSITLNAPAVAGNTVINLPAASGGSFVVSDSAGNVGIGTSSPQSNQKLSVVGSNTNALVTAGNTLEYLAPGNTNGGGIYFGVNTATASEPTAAIETSWGSADNNPQIHLGLTRDGNKTRYSAFWADSSLRLYTADNERMRIDSSGNILVSKASRGSIATDNDLSFDLNASSNFTCTPSGAGALTFTNIASAAGQSGYILLVNSGGHAITAAANTRENATFLGIVSNAGTYLISYFCDGTNVYCTTAGAMT